jgi:hypothetical protein
MRLAVDAAESAQAGNSLEKMLCHQMAAAHHAAMRLVTRVGNGSQFIVEEARVSNAAARMMQAYQEAFLTLQKIRAGGKQTFVVQHVQVSDGRQAVIAGSVKGGGRERRQEGWRGEKWDTPHEPWAGLAEEQQPLGQLTKASRCGARTGQATACQCPTMPNGRCRLHGGLSTGPKTAAGIERIRQAATKYGSIRSKRK